MILRVALSLVLAALAGCASETRIEPEDHGVFLPSARVTVHLAPATAEAPSALPAGHAVEVNLAGARNIEDRQRIPTDEDTVVFGGQAFAPGTQLQHEADFNYADVGWRWRKYFGSGGFALETFAGLGVAELDLAVASGAVVARERLSSGGLVGGVGVVWRFRPTTSLQSRLTLFGSGDEDGISSASRWEASIVQALGRNVAVRAGLASWSVFSERDERSDIHARFSGVTLALDLLF